MWIGTNTLSCSDSSCLSMSVSVYKLLFISLKMTVVEFVRDLESSRILAFGSNSRWSGTKSVIYILN